MAVTVNGDVITLGAAGDIFNTTGRMRIKAIVCSPGATGGRFVLHDGNNTFYKNVDAPNNQSVVIPGPLFPNQGIKWQSGPAGGTVEVIW